MSTVHPPRQEIGSQAARTMIELLSLPPAVRASRLSRQTAVPWQLLARGSTVAVALPLTGQART